MHTFSVTNKVALVTGGSTGIGYFCAIGLLENGAKAVTIADIDEEAGLRVVKSVSENFTENCILFVKTDVTNVDQFEEAFQCTIEAFGHVDILINNAGVLDDSDWQKTIDVNLKGTINGIHLGFENYLQTCRSTKTAVILNISSTLGLQGSSDNPVYSCTKFAVNGLTLSWGSTDMYKKTGVKIISVCPGATSTNRLHEIPKQISELYASSEVTQTAEEVATGIVKVIEHAKTGTIWIIEGGELAHEYLVPNRLSMNKVYIK